MTVQISDPIPLRHGAALPRLGLGTWPMADAEAEATVAKAIEVGYRLVDTAENYGNEVGVGRGLRAGGVPREELFVTTKFNAAWHGVDLVEQALERSLTRLGLDRVDLLLIHWPNPGQDRYVEAWRGLIALLADHRVRAIGVSNFKPGHLDRLAQETGVLPDLNQIELSPFVSRPEVRAYHAAHGIVTQSWSPLGRGGDLLTDPVVSSLADRWSATPAQIVLRWHLEHGLSAIPKSSDPERLVTNLALGDLELPPEDLAALDQLNRGEATAVDSDTFGH
jgi:2,5-diketo-D-gluconate reductase A